MTQPKSFEAHLIPMLAKKLESPFSDPEWLYEIKWEGYRIITEKKGRNCRLLSRNRLDYSNICGAYRCRDERRRTKNDAVKA